MAQAFGSLSTSEGGGNGGSPLSPKSKSFDFCGKHELEWEKIEMEIHSIAARATAVEIVGRSAVENVHGEKAGGRVRLHRL